MKYRKRNRRALALLLAACLLLGLAGCGSGTTAEESTETQAVSY